MNSRKKVDSQTYNTIRSVCIDTIKSFIDNDSLIEDHEYIEDVNDICRLTLYMSHLEKRKLLSNKISNMIISNLYKYDTRSGYKICLMYMSHLINVCGHLRCDHVMKSIIEQIDSVVYNDTKRHGYDIKFLLDDVSVMITGNV